MAKSSKKNTDSDICSVDLNDNLVTVHDGDYVPEGKHVKTFSFSDSGNSEHTKMVSEISPSVSDRQDSIPIKSDNLKSTDDKVVMLNADDNPVCIQKNRGITPKRDNEAFDIKRCYQFRPSTIKKLNMLKVSSDNINIYLNEIIDDAICYYFNAILGQS